MADEGIFQMRFSYSEFDRRVVSHAMGGDERDPASREDLQDWIRTTLDKAYREALEKFPQQKRA